MSVRVDTTDLARMVAALERAGIDARKGVTDATRKATKELQATMRRTAPKRTGALRADISSRVYSGADVVTGVAGSTIKQGFFTERGTSRMAPRPWVKPSFDAVSPKFLSAIEAAIKEAL